MCINEELFTNCVTVVVINLTANIVTGTAVMTAVIAPGHNKAAILETRHRWLILIA